MRGSMGDRNWIQQYQLENKKNPYAVQEPSMVEEVARYELELELAKNRKGSLMSQLPEGTVSFEDIGTDPKLAGIYGGLVRAQQKIDSKTRWIKQAQATDEYQQEMSGEGLVITGGGEGFNTLIEPAGGQEPRPSATPATPGWLKQMYPQLGANITKMQGIAPPGGQAWGRLAPSQQQKWAGWAQWSGAKPQDLLAQTQKMAPRQARTAGRWTPARQR